MSENEHDFGNERLTAFNGVVVGIARTVGTLTGSLSEFGQLVPLLEIAVTAGVFWRYGGHLEVIMGVFFAQLVALFLVNHYANIAMTAAGQWSIYASILVGAINTGFAISYGLNGGGGLGGFMADFVGMTAAVSIVLSYVAKLFTHDAVARRTALKARGDAALAEIKRKAKHEGAVNVARDTMQTARLGLETAAMERLANDPTMQTIQTKATYLTLVSDIMQQYQIAPQSKLGKQLLELAETAVTAGGGDAVDAAGLPPIAAANGHSNGHSNGVAGNGFLSVNGTPKGYRNGVS